MFLEVKRFTTHHVDKVDDLEDSVPDFGDVVFHLHKLWVQK